MNLQVFMYDSVQEKLQVLKKSPKSQKMGLLKKVSFLFILFCTEKFNIYQFLLLTRRERSKLPSYILLTHEGLHREVCQDFQPSLTLSAGGAKGCLDD